MKAFVLIPALLSQQFDGDSAEKLAQVKNKITAVEYAREIPAVAHFPKVNLTFSDKPAVVRFWKTTYQGTSVTDNVEVRLDAAKAQQMSPVFLIPQTAGRLESARLLDESGLPNHEETKEIDNARLAYELKTLKTVLLLEEKNLMDPKFRILPVEYEYLESLGGEKALDFENDPVLKKVRAKSRAAWKAQCQLAAAEIAARGLNQPKMNFHFEQSREALKQGGLEFDSESREKTIRELVEPFLEAKADLQSQSALSRSQAVLKLRALAKDGNTHVLKVLVEALDNDFPATALEAREAFKSLHQAGVKVAPFLIESSQSFPTRRYEDNPAGAALTFIGPSAVEACIAGIKHPNKFSQLTAIEVLGTFKAGAMQEAAAELKGVYNKSLGQNAKGDKLMRNTILRSLFNITGDFNYLNRMESISPEE